MGIVYVMQPLTQRVAGSRWPLALDLPAILAAGFWVHGVGVVPRPSGPGDGGIANNFLFFQINPITQRVTWHRDTLKALVETDWPRGAFLFSCAPTLPHGSHQHQSCDSIEALWKQGIPHP